jgi:hypothetical protein
LQDLIAKKNPSQKRSGGVAQDPEFKLQHQKKKKKEKEEN